MLMLIEDFIYREEIYYLLFANFLYIIYKKTIWHDVIFCIKIAFKLYFVQNFPENREIEK